MSLPDRSRSEPDSAKTDPTGPSGAPPSQGVELLHCDESVLVCVKPAGLLAVPGRGQEKADCLVARLQQQWPDALTVHRLDMATSGLMVFARGAHAQRALSMAFASRSVHKRYEAVVSGVLEGEGEVRLPLMADWPRRPRQKVDAAGLAIMGVAHTVEGMTLTKPQQQALTKIELNPGADSC